MRRRVLGLAALALVACCAIAGLSYLSGQGVAPRALASYVEKRAAGHAGFVLESGELLGGALRWLDRGEPAAYRLPALVVGAQPRALAPSPGRMVDVASEAQARQALSTAMAGDRITFAPGVYRLRGAIRLERAGAAGAPVVVRAAHPGSVVLELDGAEGFVVAAPYWTFENLVIRGACAEAAQCHHAFHVVGKGAHFIARNNRLMDFNAHIKINSNREGHPDAGLIEANTLTNSAPRSTASPVTPIDLVAASDWTIRANLIADFIKAGGDRISYGAFAKGAAARTVFERNVIVCEQSLQRWPGQRIGLSFGGGGTGKQYCRDKQCITEHDGGVMRDNLVLGCSDAGIYVNASAGTRLIHNTLVDTAGVQVRFPESSAELEGNLVDGMVVARDGARLQLGDNRIGGAGAYLGLHPQRRLFEAPATFGLGWSGTPPRRAVAHPVPDLCGARRPARPAYGAFEEFAACLRREAAGP